jgi:hypothetical protein
MANPFPFVASTVLTAAQLNGIGEAWTSYTPVIKGGATTVTATITYAKYAQVNKVVWVRVNATVTSAGAANGIISVSLPIASTQTGDMTTVGTFVVKDSGTAYYSGAAILSGTTVVGQAYGSGNYMGDAVPTMTLANNDAVAFFICYEVA